MNDKLKNIIYSVSAILLIIAVIGLFIAHLRWFVWLLLAGGIGYTVAHLSLIKKTRSLSLRRKRLLNLAILAGLFWIMAALFYLFRIDYWAALIVAAVLFMAYSNITQAFLHDKEGKDKEGQHI